MRHLALAFVLLVLSGCGMSEWFKKPPVEPAARPVRERTKDPVLSGTIGAQTLLSGVEPQRLRGFGLVVGLGDNGSSDCPTTIRDYLVDLFNKRSGPQLGPGVHNTPGELIDSLDTAVVQITGTTPPGAPRGTHFDLEVEALPGTSTKSLEGGLLVPCEMRFYEPSASGEGLLAGDVLAEGQGPLFVNPFTSDSSLGPGDPRRASVLGGGKTLADRPARLMMIDPSYAVARRLERRLNERFGQKPPVAEAASKGYIEIHTPPEYARDPDHFLQLAAFVYVDSQPQFLDQHMRELARVIGTDRARLPQVSLVWEAQGRVSISRLQPYYVDAEPAVRFYAARAGARLGDTNAVPVLAGLADGPSDLRLLAVRELGNCDVPQAAMRLVPLLDDEDPEIRVAAYEGLLAHRSPAVRSIVFPFKLNEREINFVLDVVDSHGKPLISVRRTRVPRIAVFGEKMVINRPVFYAHPDDTITVNAVDSSSELTLFAKTRGRPLDRMSVAPRVVDLIVALGDLPRADSARRIRGLGLPYGRVVQILSALTKDDSIPAAIYIEKPAIVEILGPDITGSERPEADQPDDEPQTPPAPEPGAPADPAFDAPPPAAQPAVPPAEPQRPE